MDDLITIADVRKAGYCVAGARRWFGHHNLDFNAFLKNGISQDIFLGTGDEQAANVVRLKKERLEHG